MMMQRPVPGRRALHQEPRGATQSLGRVSLALADPEVLEDLVQQPVKLQHRAHDDATATSGSSRCMSAWSSVVLPVPTSPVRTTNPVPSRTP